MTVLNNTRYQSAERPWFSPRGPGDTLIVIDLGGRFDAGAQVHDITLDSVQTHALQPPRTLLEYRKTQAVLDDRWGSANRVKSGALELLGPPVARTGTDIPAVLDYAAHRLGSLEGERYLIVLSDLETDTADARTSLPPASAFRFAGVSVTTMFVPWQGSAQTAPRMGKWQEWFTNAGARSFASYDEAQSRRVTPLEASQVPTRAQSPFARSGEGR